MDEIDICAFFCEDVRTEVGDKPMFLGVLSSVIMADTFPMEGGLIFASMFFVPATISSFESELKITLIHQESQQTIFESKKLFSRSIDSDQEIWVSINTFDFGDFEFPENGIIKANVRAGSSSSTRYLKAKKMFDQAFDVNVA